MQESGVAVKRVAICILLGFSAAACTDKPSQPANELAQASQSAERDRIAALEQRIEELSRKAVAQEFAAKFAANRYRTAEFDPTDSAYQRVDAPSGFGSFAVSVQDVRPLGDGVRVRLNIGNPSSAGFSAVKLKLEYGPRPPGSDDSDPESSSKWLEALKTKEVTLTEIIQPGDWNAVNVTLPDIPADQFGYLSVSLETNVVRLRGG